MGIIVICKDPPSSVCVIRLVESGRQRGSQWESGGFIFGRSSPLTKRELQSEFRESVRSESLAAVGPQSVVHGVSLCSLRPWQVSLPSTECGNPEQLFFLYSCLKLVQLMHNRTSS